MWNEWLLAWGFAMTLSVVVLGLFLLAAFERLGELAARITRDHGQNWTEHTKLTNDLNDLKLGRPAK